MRPIPLVRAKQIATVNEPEESPWSWNHFIKNLPGWLTSAIVHTIVLLVLALCTLSSKEQSFGNILASITDEEVFDILEELPEEVPIDIPTDTELPVITDSDALSGPVEITNPDNMMPGDPNLDIGIDLLDTGTLTTNIGDGGGDGGKGWAKRGDQYRRQLNTPKGRAIALALKWLAEHQMPDGGWSFDHTIHPNCNNQCRNPGKLKESRIGATGMALLPFLGAGQTHKTGAYKETVRQGLYFLVQHMKLSPKGGELYEKGGRMYSHGIASIALTEAYGMTHDKGLHQPAQAAINFICYAQDPVGGGWRYETKQAGDTSVVGWQMMALKSGHMAYLLVPPIVAKKAETYLDGVAYESGARYGYTHAGKGSDATTAIGLLCRMYLGWQKDNGALQRGVQIISDKGPTSNLYYNYYASQVMRHWEGKEYDKWKGVIWPQLINSQAQADHETGSWWNKGSHGPDTGGRLYCTSMATMILEVDYRHLPIYKRQSIEQDFPE